jgi:hypothetical protein
LSGGRESERDDRRFGGWFPVESGRCDGGRLRTFLRLPRKRSDRRTDCRRGCESRWQCYFVIVDGR